MSNIIVTFVKTAAALNLDVQDVQAMLKKATGQDVSPEELQAILSQGGQGHGGGEDPSMGGGGEDPSMGGASGQGMIDPHELQQLHQQFPQISPEELEQIAAELAQHLAGQEMGGDPSGGMGGQDMSTGMDMSSQGAQPGGAGGQMPKQGSYHEGLAKVASVPYIFGFLKRAQERGLDIRDSIILYGDGYEASRKAIQEKQALDKIASEVNIDDNTASYLESFYKQAQARGLSEAQAIELFKNSPQYQKLIAAQK